MDIISMELDVSDPSSIQTFVQQIAEKYSGKIKCLVNNAGILSHDWDEDTYFRIKQTNVDGPITLVKELTPHMADDCRIVNVTSREYTMGGVAEL